MSQFLRKPHRMEGHCSKTGQNSALPASWNSGAVDAFFSSANTSNLTETQINRARLAAGPLVDSESGQSQRSTDNDNKTSEDGYQGEIRSVA